MHPNDTRNQAVRNPPSSWRDNDIRVLIGNHWRSDRTLQQFVRAIIDAVEAEAHKIEQDRLWMNIVEMAEDRKGGVQ